MPSPSPGGVTWQWSREAAVLAARELLITRARTPFGATSMTIGELRADDACEELRLYASHCQFKADRCAEGEEDSDWYFVQFWPAEKRAHAILKRWSGGRT